MTLAGQPTEPEKKPAAQKPEKTTRAGNPDQKPILRASCASPNPAALTEKLPAAATWRNGKTPETKLEQRANHAKRRKRQETDGGRDCGPSDTAKTDFAKTKTAGKSSVRAKNRHNLRDSLIFKEQKTKPLSLPNGKRYPRG
jgi:hypothetical protein